MHPLINERKSLSVLAHEAMQERILSGYFKPGEWLRQEEMSRRRQLNRKFHGVISQASGSISLKRLTEILWNRFPFWMLYEGLHHQPRTLKPILEREIKEHRALLDAIANRDVSLVEQISASHIKGMKDDLKEVFGFSSHILEEKQQQMGL